MDPDATYDVIISGNTEQLTHDLADFTELELGPLYRNILYIPDSQKDITLDFFLTLPKFRLVTQNNVDAACDLNFYEYFSEAIKDPDFTPDEFPGTLRECAFCELEIFELVLNSRKFDSEITVSVLVTLLEGHHNYPNFLNLLLEPTVKRKEEGWKLLHTACTRRRLKVVPELLKDEEIHVNYGGSQVLKLLYNKKIFDLVLGCPRIKIGTRSADIVSNMVLHDWSEKDMTEALKVLEKREDFLPTAMNKTALSKSSFILSQNRRKELLTFFFKRDPRYIPDYHALSDAIDIADRRDRREYANYLLTVQNRGR